MASSQCVASDIQTDINNATPLLWETAVSYFYPSYKIAPIDLEAHLTSGQYACNNSDAVRIARQIVGSPEVKRVFSQPLEYGSFEKIEENNRILQQHGFALLSKKTNLRRGNFCEYYNVCEHPDLQDWIFKSAASRLPDTPDILSGLTDDRNEYSHFTSHDSLLRFEMANLLRQKALENNIQIVTPQEYAIPWDENSNNRSAEILEQYFIISQKLDLSSPEETADILRHDETLQRQYAENVITLIKKTGFCDASIDNIRLTKERQIAVIDTEPAGLLTKKNNPEHPEAGNFAKHVRIGLYNLSEQAQRHNLPILQELAAEAYQESLQSYSMIKVALFAVYHFAVIITSLAVNYFQDALIYLIANKNFTILQAALGISLPLPSLILLALAMIHQDRIYSTISYVLRSKADFIQNRRFFMRHPNFAETIAQEWNQLTSDLFPYKKKYFQLIEGIPFSSHT